jgi:hypothetical protein
MSTIKSRVSIKSSGDGLVSESEWKTREVTNNSGPAGGPYKVLLATGVNSITVPTGARGLTIEPPEASLARLNLPGVSGGTGMVMRTGQASTSPLPTGTSAALVASDREELVYIHWG